MEFKIIEKIDHGGSDRIFYRCIKGKQTYILVWDRHVEKYVALQKHLRARGVAVPKLQWVDKAANLILIEDLGDNSLFRLFITKKKTDHLYRKAINELINLQLNGYKDAPVKARYDHEHMKWEQEYFKKHFLHQFCKLSSKKLHKVDSDLASLADEFAHAAKPWRNFLMHRDYQSQNIYVKARTIRIIDFQSARIGPLTYDLASLLRDPYVRITHAAEKKFLDYYLSRLHKMRVRFMKRDFLHLYHLSCLQRNMQALGAFVNLSLNKGKVHFKQHIPRGLDLLRRGLKTSRFTKLTAVIMDIQLPRDVI